MRYLFLSIFLIIFIGCGSKSFATFGKRPNNKEYSFDVELHNHHKDIISLQNEVNDLVKDMKGNGSIIGKINYQKSNIYNNSIKEKSYFTSNRKRENPVKYHSYKTISLVGEFTDLNNTTTTFILFPKNLKKQNRNTKKYKRYAQVLELIQELKRVKDNNSSDISKKYENRFVLPNQKLNNEEKITVETYNYDLANKIIDFFRSKIAPSFFDKERPFFITITENIFNKKGGASFLYLDLSTFNDSAITQVIESYKNRLVKKGDSDIDILEEWNYHILSAITNFSDKFHLLNFAYAGDE